MQYLRPNSRGCGSVATTSQAARFTPPSAPPPRRLLPPSSPPPRQAPADAARESSAPAPPASAGVRRRGSTRSSPPRPPGDRPGPSGLTRHVVWDGPGKLEGRRVQGGGDCRRSDEGMNPETELSQEEKGDEVIDSMQDQDGVPTAALIEGSKHRDGSIYRQDAHFYHSLYRLYDTRETFPKPMEEPKDCWPNFPACRRHNGCAMMQVFSLKLANPVDFMPSGPVHLYGFMAVRDLLHPLRNYIFHRPRDDPLVLYPHSNDPSSLLIQMAGPKRGIYLQSRALIEFDIKIKSLGQDIDEDSELIDGAATISELTPFHGVYTQRIRGYRGAAVDISLALLRHAVEARIQVGISKLPMQGICLTILCFVSGLPEGIKLFDSLVDKPGDLNSLVVAVMFNTPLILHFHVKQAAGSDQVHRRYCAFPAKAHGYNRHSLPLDFADIRLQVAWANLPF
ncbi:hypothetical protein ACP4OV_009865 [Aristida adscensionis]